MINTDGIRSVPNNTNRSPPSGNSDQAEEITYNNGGGAGGTRELEHQTDRQNLRWAYLNTNRSDTNLHTFLELCKEYDILFAAETRST